MSLSARIAIDPSRRIALAGAIVPIGGVAAAAAAVAARWPVGAAAIIGACLVAIAIAAHAIRAWRRAGRHVLVVSDRAEFDVVGNDPAALEAPWRLVDPTMAWSGFAVLAMAQDEGRVVMRLPVVTASLAARERRALDRFLLWSLRGGAGVAPASGRPTVLR